MSSNERSGFESGHRTWQCVPRLQVMGFPRDTFYRCQTALTATSIKSGKCQIKSRLLHASEVQQNATVTPSSSAFEWRSSEDCYHLADNGFGNQCNEIRFEIYKEANPERGITFETIGKGETCNDIGSYPIMIDINILKGILEIFKGSDIGLKYVFPYNSILTTAVVCDR